jgi:drug/metabolite transporter (DMT)-like permease
MNGPNRENRMLLTAAFATVYLVWGSTYLAIRVAVETLPPFAMASARFLIAGGLLLVLSRLRGTAWPSRVQWRDAAVSGTLMLAGGNGLVSWAERSVSSGLAALIVATVPAWFALFDWIRPGGNRPTGITLAGIAVGFAGVGLLLSGRPTQGQGMQFTAPGLVAMILSTAAWAAGSICSKHGHRPESPVMGTAIQMSCGGLVLLGVALCRREWVGFDLSRVSAHSWMAWAYLVILGSFIAFNAFTYLLRHASPASVSTYAFVNPVVAVFLGWLILGEAITPRTVAAMVVILSGVVLITLGPIAWARVRPGVSVSDRI